MASEEENEETFQGKYTKNIVKKTSQSFDAWKKKKKNIKKHVGVGSYHEEMTFNLSSIKKHSKSKQTNGFKINYNYY